MPRARRRNTNVTELNEYKPTIKAATWSEHERAIRSVRHTVFVVEQRVPEELDFDGVDPTCCHALAFSGNKVVGTGRVQTDGHIGRVAVLKAWRGQGIGSALVEFLADAAKRKGLSRLYLNAQVSAVEFYEKLGFQRTGNLFMEAGIEHIAMVRETE
jgi:predicted GNAT family N-acyltransferase